LKNSQKDFRVILRFFEFQYLKTFFEFNGNFSFITATLDLVKIKIPDDSKPILIPIHANKTIFQRQAIKDKFKNYFDWL
jgi:hypothetical protein